MGQKAQLWWDLPAADSFLLLARSTGSPTAEFRPTLDELTSMLDVDDQLTRPGPRACRSASG